MSLPRFFAPAIAPAMTVVRLPAGEARHLTRVLRVRVGQDVRVFDGRGGEWRARVLTADRAVVDLELIEPAVPAPEAPLHVTLAVGVLKGSQMDAVVRDATMLGVARVRPVRSAHTAVPAAAADDDHGRRRWLRIAVSSAKQCGRAVVPEILPPVSFADLVGGDQRDPTYMCVEPSASSADGAAAWPDLPRPEAALVLIGPEGGWSAEEVSLATSHGARPLSLGPRTLRAETVPAVLLGALWSRWGW